MGLYHYNPCKIGRHPALVTIGDGLAEWFEKHFEEPTDGCPCCMAVRILLFSAVVGLAGFLLGVLL